MTTPKAPAPSSTRQRSSPRAVEFTGALSPDCARRLKETGAVELKATRYAVEDRIATITLARPKRRNAWTGRMHTEYRWILREADRDPAVRAIVVTGDAEGNAFCAG